MKVKEALDAMHKNVSARVEKGRTESVRKYNQTTNIITPNIRTGDHVMLRIER